MGGRLDYLHGLNNKYSDMNSKIIAQLNVKNTQPSTGSVLGSIFGEVVNTGLNIGMMYAMQTGQNCLAGTSGPSNKQISKDAAGVIASYPTEMAAMVTAFNGRYAECGISVDSDGNVLKSWTQAKAEIDQELKNLDAMTKTTTGTGADAKETRSENLQNYELAKAKYEGICIDEKTYNNVSEQLGKLEEGFASNKFISGAPPTVGDLSDDDIISGYLNDLDPSIVDAYNKNNNKQGTDKTKSITKEYVVNRIKTTSARYIGDKKAAEDAVKQHQQLSQQKTTLLNKYNSDGSIEQAKNKALDEMNALAEKHLTGKSEEQPVRIIK